jgi:hypothetical protein
MVNRLARRFNEVIGEYLALWDLISDFALHPGVDVAHAWKLSCLSTSGQYSAKSAYLGFFQGFISFGPWERIWKSWSSLARQMPVLHVACNA